jgi:hypothetical protein
MKLDYELEQEEKGYRKRDEKIESHFFLLYLLKHRYSSFLLIEKFVIKLAYFFNINYFNDLLKLTTLRSVIYLYHFMIIFALIYCPIITF